MNANLRGRVRKLVCDAEIEQAIADPHPGPDDIVVPVTWQRPAVHQFECGGDKKPAG